MNLKTLAGGVTRGVAGRRGVRQKWGEEWEILLAVMQFAPSSTAILAVHGLKKRETG